MNKDQYDALIESGVTPFKLPEEHMRFLEIVAAYKRGAEWMAENNEPEYLAKAAHDYADKITSAKTSQ